MRHKEIIFLFIVQLACCASALYAADLENRIITITSNERMDLINGDSVQFQFQPLSNTARELEITNKAASLGVIHVGKARIKEDATVLTALRAIANQIAESLDLNFAVIADSNTSHALWESELLLLYHPDLTITLALVKSSEENHYEIACTYALREGVTSSTKAEP